MNLHLIEGEPGCQFAKDNACVAVIVDALRASATAAMLLHHGATRILAVREVEDALKAKNRLPHALLFGERNTLPPEGFDHGNSPLETEAAHNKPVIFTTTTGTARLMQAHGAPALYMGTTTNAMAVMLAAMSHDRDVVLIPAGRAGDPDFDALEDWAAATAMALLVDYPIGEGAAFYRETRHLIDLDGLEKVIASAPHAATLREAGFDRDIAFCARLNVTQAVPVAVDREDPGIVLKEAAIARPESMR